MIKSIINTNKNDQTNKILDSEQKSIFIVAVSKYKPNKKGRKKSKKCSYRRRIKRWIVALRWKISIRIFIRGGHIMGWVLVLTRW
jgi:hypothetical protein